MHHRQVFVQQDIAVVDALLPAAVIERLPVDWMIESFLERGDFNRFTDVFVEELGEGFFQLRRAAGFEPLPALVAPILRLAIAAFFDEFQIIAVGHRRASDAERFDLDLMGPFLVVEDERDILRSRR